MRAPDPAFADPRLAALYDVLDAERDDLDLYVSIAAEVGARRVVDVGCGTGSLAVRLAGLGLDVVGVDPATASLDVARAKPGADRVRWVEGDATALPGAEAGADLVVMTGNVAQVFVEDADWHRTLDAVGSWLPPGGWWVFETRRPDARAWEGWDVAPTQVALEDGRSIVVSRVVARIALPLVTFRSTTVVDGDTISSESTLRFRELDEVREDLLRHGFAVVEVRDAPDRPGAEWVVLARRLPVTPPATPAGDVLPA